MGASVSACCAERDKCPDPFLIPRRPPPELLTAWDFDEIFESRCPGYQKARRRHQEEARESQEPEQPERPQRTEQPEEQWEQPAEQQEEDKKEQQEKEEEVLLSLVVRNTFLHYIATEPEGTDRQRSASVPRAFQPRSWLCGADAKGTCSEHTAQRSHDDAGTPRARSRLNAAAPQKAEVAEVRQLLVTKNTFLEYAHRSMRQHVPQRYCF